MGKLYLDQLAATNMVYARFSFDYYLESVKRLGVRNIEIYGCSGHFHFFDGDDAVRTAIRKVKESGLKVISMMPEENVYPVNIAAKEDRLRQNTVDLYKKFMDAARELDCHQMLLCPGRPYRDLAFSEGYKYARESIQQLVEYGQKIDVVLCYETLRVGESTLTTNLQDLKLMVDDIDSPYFKVCIDTVPVFCAHEHVADYCQALGDKVWHFHLNDGAPDGHLMWGDGIHDVDDHLNGLREHNYTRYITMEMAAGKYRMDPEYYYKKNIEYLIPHFDGGSLSGGNV